MVQNTFVLLLCAFAFFVSSSVAQFASTADLPQEFDPSKRNAFNQKIPTINFQAAPAGFVDPLGDDVQYHSLLDACNRYGNHVRVGVYNEIGNATLTVEQWTPTFVTYLNGYLNIVNCTAHVESVDFEDFDEWLRFADEGELCMSPFGDGSMSVDWCKYVRPRGHFIFVNPAMTVTFGQKYGLTTVASAVHVTRDQIHLDRFGGAVAQRKTAGDASGIPAINSWDDFVTNKAVLQTLRATICIPSRQSFGGWHMQKNELLKAGMNNIEAFTIVEVGTDADALFSLACYLGKNDGNPKCHSTTYGCDFATFRTDTYENFAADHSELVGQVRLINELVTPMSAEQVFPLVHSTPLYPEWTVSALPHIPENLRWAASIPLMYMDRNGTIARDAGHGGFIYPYTTTTIEEVLLNINFDNSSRCGVDQFRDKVTTICSPCLNGTDNKDRLTTGCVLIPVFEKLDTTGFVVGFSILGTFIFLGCIGGYLVYKKKQENLLLLEMGTSDLRKLVGKMKTRIKTTMTTATHLQTRVNLMQKLDAMYRHFPFNDEINKLNVVSFALTLAEFAFDLKPRDEEKKETSKSSKSNKSSNKSKSKGTARSVTNDFEEEAEVVDHSGEKSIFLAKVVPLWSQQLIDGNWTPGVHGPAAAKYTLSFDAVMSNPATLALLKQHMAKEICVENIEFILEVGRYRKVQSTAVREILAREIVMRFVNPNSVQQINISSDGLRKFKSHYAKQPMGLDIFNAPQKEVLKLIKSNSFARLQEGQMGALLGFILHVEKNVPAGMTIQTEHSEFGSELSRGGDNGMSRVNQSLVSFPAGSGGVTRTADIEMEEKESI